MTMWDMAVVEAEREEAGREEAEDWERWDLPVVTWLCMAYLSLVPIDRSLSMVSVSHLGSEEVWAKIARQSELIFPSQSPLRSLPVL